MFLYQLVKPEITLADKEILYGLKSLFMTF